MHASERKSNADLKKNLFGFNRIQIKNKKTKKATAESFGGLFCEICKILLL